MSIPLVTHGYIGIGGTVQPQGPATIIEGPNSLDSEEFVPTILDVEVSNDFSPVPLDSECSDNTPSTVDSESVTYVPDPTLVSTLVPTPLDSERGDN